MTTNLFDSCDIGLKRTDVFLAPHSKNWSTLYTLESLRISEYLCAYLPKLELHHIGSTAVKDLMAKPVIDILGGVEDVNRVDQFEQIFKDLGYVYKGEYGIPGRRYLTLYSLDKEVAYVHLHIFNSNTEVFKDHLLFRDTLNNNPSLRKEYETLKLSLIKEGISRNDYSNAKSALIKKIITLSKT